jgi:hypothetical protein
MALDGTKIVDSDFTHDIYSEFMDLYDAEFDIQEIQKQIEAKYRVVNPEDDDDLEDYEMFITTYCLALWEIGHLSENNFQELTKSIEKGATVKMWSEESPKDGKQREQELKRLIKKLSEPKKNPRNRKKYKLVTNFIFNENDAVVFKAKDQKYRASIVAKIDQHRGHCSYDFITLDVIKSDLPTLEDLLSSNILVREIGSGYTKEETIRKQPNIDELWEGGAKYFLGLNYTGIEHKDLLRLKSQFTKIGQITIKSQFKSLGSIGYDSEYEKFVERNFANTDEYIKIFGGKKLPLKRIIE